MLLKPADHSVSQYEVGYAPSRFPIFPEDYTKKICVFIFRVFSGLFYDPAVFSVVFGGDLFNHTLDYNATWGSVSIQKMGL